VQASTPLCRIPASDLARCLSGTVGATAARCVRIDVRGGSVAFVVCQGGSVYAAEAVVEQSVDDAEVFVHSADARKMMAAAKRHGDEPAQLTRAENAVSLAVGGEVVSAQTFFCGERSWRASVPCRRAQPTKVLAADFLAACSRAAKKSVPCDLLEISFSSRSVCISVPSMGGKSAACPALGTAVETVLRVDPNHLRGWFGSLSPDAVVTVDPGDGRVPAVFSHDDALAVVPIAGGCCAAIEEVA